MILDAQIFPFTQEGWRALLRELALEFKRPQSAVTLALNTTLIKGCAKLFWCNTSKGAIIVVLPPAADMKDRTCTFVKTTSDANAVTLDGYAAETIDGSTTTAELSNQYDVLSVISDGSEWYTFYRANADLTITDASMSGTLTVDTINEYTAAAGVTIDSVLLKDGGATLTSDITMTGDGKNYYFKEYVYGVTFTPYMQFYYARGTEAVPTVVADDDIVAQFDFKGYSGAASAYRTLAQIHVEVDGTPDSGGDTTDMPGRFTFWTTPEGSATPLERLRIDNAGAVQLPAAGVLDCMTNGAYFKPRRLSQSTIPTPDSGELLVWRDSDDSKTYLVYNDTDEGVRSVEMI